LRYKTGMKRKKPLKSADNATFANSDLQHIEQLLKFMSEHNLEEFEYAQGDLRIRLKKPSAASVVAARAFPAPEIIISGGHAAPVTSDAASAAPPSVSPPATHTQEARAAEDLHLVKSPIVGTYYGSPSPGAEPFVKVGGYIETGQTLCIVEAMKLMNEIESDISGEVLRIFVENGQPVEYGQPLFGIRPSRKK
jgi:acetyl-CoA carboxylase biotin carboxyl carrier protein